MLVCPDKRLVLFTPPKCGTQTLHQVLPRHGCKAVLAPQFDGGIDEHTTLLPFDVWQDLASYRFAVAVRHPYTRTASLYGHYRHYWPPPHLGFEEFVEQIVVAPRHLFFNATISSILQPVEHPLDGRPPIQVRETVRLEHLALDLRRLGFAVPDPLPRVHALPNRGIDEFTPWAKQLVDLWSRHDFERFGYARELAAASAPG